jgi:hypothetical protein
MFSPEFSSGAEIERHEHAIAWHNELRRTVPAGASRAMALTLTRHFELYA